MSAADADVRLYRRCKLFIFNRKRLAIEKEGAESVWACLPAGPLERHFIGGGPGGMIGEGVLIGEDLRKGEKRLPWKGHNSGKPLLVNGYDAAPL